MPGYHCQVVLRHRNQKPEDSFTNTFNVYSPAAPDEATAAQIAADIAGFYSHNSTSFPTVSPRSYMSEVIDDVALAHTVKVYGVSGGQLSGDSENFPLGSPLVEDTFTLDPADTESPLPEEVAICVTLEGSGRLLAPVEIGSTRPKQRHTGRFYFGPLNSGTLKSLNPGSAGAEVQDACITVLSEGVVWLDQQMGLDVAGGGLAVWSRANATMYPLEAVSVDRNFDTVRSRGMKGSGRVRTAI